MLKIQLKAVRSVLQIEEYHFSYPFNTYAVSKNEKKIYWSLDTFVTENINTKKAFRISYLKKINLTIDPVININPIKITRKDGAEITLLNTKLKDKQFDGLQMLLFEKRDLFMFEPTPTTLIKKRQRLPNILLKRNTAEAQEQIQFILRYIGDDGDLQLGNEKIIIYLNLFEEKKNE